MDIATKFANGEEAVGALFSEGPGKGKRKDSAAEGSHPKEPHKKKKNKGRKGKGQASDSGDEDFVGAVDRKPPRAPGPRTQTPGTFEDTLKKPCPHHKFPVKHTLEECNTLRKYFSKLRAIPEEEEKEEKKDTEGDPGGPESYPRVENCFMIYGGKTSNMTSRQRKKERREVFAAEPAVPKFRKWSEQTIAFGQADHPQHIPNPGAYPLVVDPVIGNTRLTKVLMDGGSSLNLIYEETLDLLGVARSKICPGGAAFHGVAPGKQVLPLGQIDLPVCLGTPSNFRTETLTFEVLGFRGTYHAVLGRPCYAKFMAIPNYTYLQLKMPGPHGVITTGPSFRHVYECDVECVEYAEALLLAEALIADAKQSFDKICNEPEAKRHAGGFEPSKATKTVPLDPKRPGEKLLTISSELDPK
jgi:hypothetical protein